MNYERWVFWTGRQALRAARQVLRCRAISAQVRVGTINH